MKAFAVLDLNSTHGPCWDLSSRPLAVSSATRRESRHEVALSEKWHSGLLTLSRSRSLSMHASPLAEEPNTHLRRTPRCGPRELPATLPYFALSRFANRR